MEKPKYFGQRQFFPDSSFVILALVACAPRFIRSGNSKPLCHLHGRNRAFSFGSPSVSEVIDQYPEEETQPDQSECTQIPDQNILALSQKHDELNERLDELQKKSKKVVGQNINELDLNELLELRAKFENLKEKIDGRKKEMCPGSTSGVKVYEDENLSKFKNGEGASCVPEKWLKLYIKIP